MKNRLLILATIVMALKAYSDVIIASTIDYFADGTVHYAGCSSDHYQVNPHTTTSGIYRGGCLITEISGYVYLPSGMVTASSYESSGTGYDSFAIIFKDNSYHVVRPASSALGQCALSVEEGEFSTEDCEFSDGEGEFSTGEYEFFFENELPM